MEKRIIIKENVDLVIKEEFGYVFVCIFEYVGVFK